MARALLLSTLLLGVLGLAAGASADPTPEELRVKRQEVFEFTARPAVTRQGDQFTITFASKGFCDATVAIQDADGRIVRHLASGCLGPNAPAPFQRDSLSQRIVWDGKDDQGRYLDAAGATVRVSLGLRGRFERTLFWSPHKRLHQGAGRWGFTGTQGGLPTPRIVAAPEGVYVFEGRGFDHLRLFDHQGNYLRTIYPPPAGRIDRIVGLERFAFPQQPDVKLPLKHDILQTTFLTSGPSGRVEKVPSMFGTAATALAVRGDRVALVNRGLNRLATDGGSGGLPLVGPEVSLKVRLTLDGIEQRLWHVPPTSAAFSPDGRTLYLAGFMWRQGRHSVRIAKECVQGVARLDFAAEKPAEVFAGTLDPLDEGGQGDGQFRDPTSIDVDEAGRVYVSDFVNDRIQVFSPAGAHLKNIPIEKPALVRVHRKTGELYVFSWVFDHGRTLGEETELRGEVAVPARLTRLGGFDDPRVKAAWPLPLMNHHGRYARGKEWGGLEYTAEIDSWTDPVTVWLVPGVPGPGMAIDTERLAGGPETSWQQAAVKLLVVRGDKLEPVRDFSADAAEAVGRLTPPMFGRQRLYVNPGTGLLYVAEGQAGNAKFLKDVLEIDPASGRIRTVALPFDVEDLTFDAQGQIYLRTHDLVVRYALPGWREVPFDYGEERKNVGTSSSRDGRRAEVISGLPLYNGTGWHKGGLFVNLRGDIAASCFVTKGDAIPFLELRTDEKQVSDAPRSPYFTPRIYPGRLRFGEIHVWNKHGQMIHQDVVPGLVDCYGVGLDKDHNVYVLAAPSRVYDGRPYFNRMAGTMMKFAPGAGKIVADRSHLIPVPLTKLPDRSADLIKNDTRFWVDGVDWMYGGVGYCGKNPIEEGGHCACYNCRFALDYFGRSFAPEVRRFNVAVLDSNGNLLLRIGRYGNVDDGAPLVRDGGPAGPRPIGGDETALMHGAYVAVQTDRRLFVADPGNARIVSIKLDYHATETVAAK